ncbi:MAG: HAD-IA family hydrolase [Phycisphaeraceae bacterium]
MTAAADIFPPDYGSFAALVFDCDGTLADTMPAHFVAWSETTRRYGLELPEARFYELGGVPAHRIMALLAREQGVAIDALAAAHEKELAFERHLDSVQPIEPVVAIARQYRGKLPMAVATGGMRRIVERCLMNLGMADWFDALVSAEDVEHHKPAPDTYLLAAQRLHVHPAHCCAFEDTDLGLAAARAAGMTAVDIRRLLGPSA